MDPLLHGPQLLASIDPHEFLTLRELRELAAQLHAQVGPEGQAAARRWSTRACLQEARCTPRPAGTAGNAAPPARPAHAAQGEEPTFANIDTLLRQGALRRATADRPGWAPAPTDTAQLASSRTRCLWSPDEELELVRTVGPMASAAAAHAMGLRWDQTDSGMADVAGTWLPSMGDAGHHAPLASRLRLPVSCTCVLQILRPAAQRAHQLGSGGVRAVGGGLPPHGAAVRGAWLPVGQTPGW